MFATFLRRFLPLLLVALPLTMPVPALAGDAATLEFTGFSQDGRYIAFAEHGVWDGSGFPWARITFVDVEKNDWVGTPHLESVEEGPGDPLRAARWACRDRYERLGIRAGNQGSSLALTEDEHFETPTGGTVSSQSFEVKGHHYALILEQIPVEGGDWDMRPHKLKLTLSDVDRGTRKILQEDRKLPESRSGAFAYAIDSAWLYDDHYLAVFLSIGLPGFEGPDTRYMAITGTLPSSE